jgi:hypothetical protein
VELAKWTKSLYGVSWRDPALYDAVLNVEQVSVEGAVATLAGMTRLDEFRTTPESRAVLDDLCCSPARCRSPLSATCARARRT